ncbi:MAG: nucleotidyltransferase family protein [Deltaproteobacteria bacterium]|jgi:mannose-1-phosphate guanylyltransferase|nr:nucleotidyltransferase family protein [Deltaproteobacteria bacterium]
MVITNKAKMTAMLLCAGFGQRLRPLTLKRPKPLFPVLNRSMLSYWLSRLSDSGIERVIINAHYQAEMLIEAVNYERSRFSHLEIIVSMEPEILGTGGGLKAAAKFFNGPFFVVNVDIWSDISLLSLYKAHMAEVIKPSATIALIDCPYKATVSLDINGRIIGFRSKAPLKGETRRLCGAGLMVLDPEILLKMPEGFSDIIDRLISYWDKGKPIGVFYPKAFWLDMGTVEEYFDLNFRLASGRRFWGENCDNNLKFKGAQIEGFLVAEEGAQIFPGAKVKDCVLWREASIGPEAIVTGAIVAGMVPEKAVITGGAVVNF